MDRGAWWTTKYKILFALGLRKVGYNQAYTHTHADAHRRIEKLPKVVY